MNASEILRIVDAIHRDKNIEKEIVFEGIDLSSFDDWIAQIEQGEESVVGPSVLFVPMARVEKMLLDRASGELPSLAERFERRTGRTVQDVLGA